MFAGMTDCDRNDSGKTQLDSGQQTDVQSTSSFRRIQSVIHIKPHHTFSSSPPELSAQQPTTSSHQTFFSSIRDTAYTYTKLYNLLIDSTVDSTQLITSYPDIPLEKMMVENLEDINDEQVFQIGLARKYCSYTLITHAALAFRNVDTGKFLVIGRQNEQFLKENVSDPSPSFLRWSIGNALDYHTLFRFIYTRMDNEMKYNFFPGTLFNAEMVEATLSGAEIKLLINEVNAQICEKQSYDVIHSNCYSSVTFGLSKAFKMMADKLLHIENNSGHTPAVDTQIANNKNLKQLFTLICHALQDNYKMGAGSINNEVVNNAIQQTIDILTSRNMLHIIDNTIIQGNDWVKKASPICNCK